MTNQIVLNDKTKLFGMTNQIAWNDEQIAMPTEKSSGRLFLQFRVMSFELRGRIMASGKNLLALFLCVTAACAAQTASSVYVNPRAGSDDPRIGLKVGVQDAGQAAFGLQLLTAIPKPAVFDPPPPPPPPAGSPAGRFAGNGLTYANSDLAFQGNHVFMGNFYGITIYDVADPAKAKLITTIVCPGGQGDVSVFGNLLFMSVEGGGRIDCGTQGIPLPAGYVAPPAPAPGEARRPAPPPPSPERIRGIRIFDISDIRNPRQVSIVQTCRGSHTHTIFQDPKDKDDVYVYIAGSAPARQSAELAGCSAGGPDDPTTANFTIVVIKVPIKHPEMAKVVSSPRIFSDPDSGKVDGLMSAQVHGEGTPRATTGCHDITVFEPMGLAAGACSGNGIVLDIKDPANPKRLEAVTDPNFSFWHSANFSNNGKKLIFTDEWGGGTQPRCRATDPMNWGADTLFDLSPNGKLKLESYYKMPAPQTELENCVAHNGSLIPIPGRDILVQAWYQGGVSVMDFTDIAHPMEIAYFDRGPLDPNKMIIGGEWSAYWYNGYIYGSEIARGLDVFKLVPNKYLTQNEIDAANQVHFNELNVQDQPQVTWPSNLIVAKAYVDQLARGTSVSADMLAKISAAIDGKKTKELKADSAMLDKGAASAATPQDAERMRALAGILK
jgi:hypothetical protein